MKPYPLWRDYKLYELDGGNCKLVTGMSYQELRRYASVLTTEGEEENCNDPAWDAILNLDARKVWEARQRTA